MAGSDLVRWRRKRDLAPMAGSARVISAAGRDPARITGVTSSAAIIPVGDRRESMRARSARQGWQSEAYAYLDGVGELRYAVQTSANAISRCRLYPGLQVDPTSPPVPLSDLGANEMPASVVAAAYEDLDLLNGPGHGLSAMQHNQSINKQVVGEYYIVGMPYDPDTGEESWGIRSIDEVIVDTDGRWFLRDRPPGFQGYDELPVPLGEDVFVARCWDQHPRFRALAWSQMRPLLESLEELLLASRMIRSTLRSRIAGAGILLVPDELELLGINPTNQDFQSSPFFEELAKAMLTPIQSEGDPSEVVPMVVRGPGQILSELRHLTLDRPIDQHAMAIRGELIRRIAIGIDWPPELLLGVGDVSHWAQWFVDESTFRYHYEPQAISSVRQWTQGYAQPMLLAREWDAATEEKAKRVVWWYDPTELLTHPDRTKDAIQLYTMDVLNDEALLRAAGFDPENDKPTPQDFLVRLMSKFRSFPPNVVEAIIHRFDPTLDIPADKTEPGMGPQGPEQIIGAPAGAPPAVGAPAPPSGGETRGGPPEPPADAIVAAALARLLGVELPPEAIVAGGSTGAMVALYPTPEQAAQLALDGGEPPETLHVTLAYLGHAADLTGEQVNAAAGVCLAISRLHAPLEGAYGGVARFTASGSSDGMDPIVALPDVQGLVALRNMLCEHLSAAGVPLPSEHGFQPHTTLAYVEQDAPSPLDRLDEPVPASFGHVSLILGSTRTDYPLAGVAEPLVAAAPARKIAHAQSRRLAEIDRKLRERLRAATDAAVRRQLEKAGARLKSRLNGQPDLRATVKDVPQTHYAQALGRDALAHAGIEPEALLGDDYTELRGRFDGWVSAAQTQALTTARQITPISAATAATVTAAQEQHRAAAWSWLSSGLATVAADRLFDPSPTPPPVGEHDGGFIVDAQLIRAAIAIAGGFGSEEGAQGLAPDGTPIDPEDFLGGIGTGVTIAATLEDSGAEVVEWEWIYGASERSFEPHVALDGIAYTSHDDDQLANAYGWPETEFFYAGDHDGCDCTEQPTWGVAVDDTAEGDAAAEEDSGESVAASGVVRPKAGAFDRGAAHAAIDRLLTRAAAFEFNSDQPRDEHGRWEGSGSSKETGSRGAGDETKSAATERLSMVSEKVGAEIAAGRTSDKMFVDANGDYTAERLAQQDKVMEALYARGADVPNDREAVMLGGLPGSGKSSSLEATGIDGSRYLTLNPDETRDEMLRQGMGVPVEGLSPRETSSLIHEEASTMTYQLAERAQSDGKNVLWDITMDPKSGDNPAAGVEARLSTLERNGYRTDMVFVRADSAVAADRALGRYAAGLGTDLGGRPTSGLLGSDRPTSGINNEGVFERVRDRAANWWLYDNNGTAPKLVDSGS